MWPPNVDHGGQATSLASTGALLYAGITGSIGTVGDGLDNALILVANSGAPRSMETYRLTASTSGRSPDGAVLSTCPSFDSSARGRTAIARRRTRIP
jgi:uncharacterized protein YaaQ